MSEPEPNLNLENGAQVNPNQTWTAKTFWAGTKPEPESLFETVRLPGFKKCEKRDIFLNAHFGPQAKRGGATVTDLENFGGGDFKHKTSKIRMSSPKLGVIFGPKSEIQTFFCPKSGGLQKKKKKVFTKIESDFSAEIGNSSVFFAQN